MLRAVSTSKLTLWKSEDPCSILSRFFFFTTLTLNTFELQVFLILHSAADLGPAVSQGEAFLHAHPKPGLLHQSDAGTQNTQDLILHNTVLNAGGPCHPAILHILDQLRSTAIDHEKKI